MHGPVNVKFGTTVTSANAAQFLSVRATCHRRLHGLPLRSGHKTLTARRPDISEIFVVWMSGNWSGGTMSKPWKYIFVHGKKRNGFQFHALNTSVQQWKESNPLCLVLLLQNIILLVRTERQQQSCFHIVFHTCDKCTTFLPSYVLARCVYSLVRGKMQSNNAFIYW